MLSKIPEEPKIRFTGRLEELKLEKLRITDGMTVRNLWIQIKERKEVLEIKKQLSKKFGLSLSSIERLVSGRGSISIEFVNEVLELWKIYCKPSDEKVKQVVSELEENSIIKGNSNSTPVVLPKFLTPKLSYLIGSLRDGSLPEVYNNQYEIQFSQLNVEWLENVIKPTIKDVFGFETEVEKYGNQTPRIKIYSKPVYFFIKKFFDCPERLQVTWEIPKIIRNSPLEIKKWFIRGFFDSEGEVNIKQKRITIHHSWDGTIPIVLEQLKNILENDFQIKSKVSKPHKEKNFPSFDLRIRKEDIWLFYDKIGTCHSEKEKKFQEMKELLTAHSLAV